MEVSSHFWCNNATYDYLLEESRKSNPDASLQPLGQFFGVKVVIDKYMSDGRGEMGFIEQTKLGPVRNVIKVFEFSGAVKKTPGQLLAEEKHYCGTPRAGYGWSATSVIVDRDWHTRVLKFLEQAK